MSFGSMGPPMDANWSTKQTISTFKAARRVSTKTKDTTPKKSLSDKKASRAGLRVANVVLPRKKSVSSLINRLKGSTDSPSTRDGPELWVISDLPEPVDPAIPSTPVSMLNLKCMVEQDPADNPAVHRDVKITPKAGIRGGKMEPRDEPSGLKLPKQLSEEAITRRKVQGGLMQKTQGVFDTSKPLCLPWERFLAPEDMTPQEAWRATFNGVVEHAARCGVDVAEWRNYITSYIMGEFNISSVPPHPPMHKGFDFLSALLPPDEAKQMALRTALDLNWDGQHVERIAEILRSAMNYIDIRYGCVSVFDAQKEVIKAEVGYSEPYFPRMLSIGGHVLYSGQVLVVLDTLKDWRFARGPLVIDPKGPRIRFYAGAPMITESGLIVGVLSVASVNPRDTFSTAQQTELMHYAAAILQLLSLPATSTIAGVSQGSRSPTVISYVEPDIVGAADKTSNDSVLSFGSVLTLDPVQGYQFPVANGRNTTSSRTSRAVFSYGPLGHRESTPPSSDRSSGSDDQLQEADDRIKKRYKNTPTRFSLEGLQEGDRDGVQGENVYSHFGIATGPYEDGDSLDDQYESSPSGFFHAQQRRVVMKDNVERICLGRSIVVDPLSSKGDKLLSKDNPRHLAVDDFRVIDGEDSPDLFVSDSSIFAPEHLSASDAALDVRTSQDSGDRKKNSAYQGTQISRQSYRSESDENLYMVSKDRARSRREEDVGKPSHTVPDGAQDFHELVVPDVNTNLQSGDAGSIDKHEMTVTNGRDSFESRRPFSSSDLTSVDNQHPNSPSRSTVFWTEEDSLFPEFESSPGRVKSMTADERAKAHAALASFEYESSPLTPKQRGPAAMLPTASTASLVTSASPSVGTNNDDPMVEVAYACKTAAQALGYDMMYVIAVYPSRDFLSDSELVAPGGLRHKMLTGFGVEKPLEFDAQVHLNVLRSRGYDTWWDPLKGPKSDYATGIVKTIYTNDDDLMTRSSGVIVGAYKKYRQDRHGTELHPSGHEAAAFLSAAGEIKNILVRRKIVKIKSRSSGSDAYPANEATEVGDI